MTSDSSINWYERNGAKLRYERNDAAGDPIVFVHGLTCRLENWRFQVAHFSKTNQTIAVDLRGHGESEVGDDPICLESFGADVAALLRELDLTNVTIVGHSMGCRVIMETCRLEPARIKSVVLVDGSRRTAGGTADEREALIHAGVREKGYAKYHRDQFGAMFTPDSDPVLRDAIIEECAATPEAVGVASSVSIHRWDAGAIDGVLAHMSAPILIIQSTKPDPKTLRAPVKSGEVTDYMTYVRATAVKSPKVQFETVADIGHFTMLERPDEVNGYMDGFLSGV